MEQLSKMVETQDERADELSDKYQEAFARYRMNLLQNYIGSSKTSPVEARIRFANQLCGFQGSKTMKWIK